MRLWHYDLIPVLPNQMLISQWRECIAIKRQWEKGTLKHRLVSYVMDYDKTYFLNYLWILTIEMSKRNIQYKESLEIELIAFCLTTEDSVKESNFCYYKEHNYRYLVQCYCNLQEKADRGIITQEEWQLIDEKFGHLL